MRHIPLPARRRVDAVTYAGTFGHSACHVCHDIDNLRTLIDVVGAMEIV
jgi:hypothetical protein